MGYSGFLFSDYKKVKSNFKYYPISWLFTQIILTTIVYLFCDANFLVKLILSCLIFLSFIFYILKNKTLLIDSPK